MGVCFRKISVKKAVQIIHNPVFMFAVYRIGLDVSYRLILSSFGSEGFTYSFRFWRWIGLLFISILVYALITEKKRTVSTLFIELMLWMAYAPFACFYALSGRNVTFFLLMSICFVVIRMILSLQNRLKMFSLRRLFNPLITWVLQRREILGRLCFLTTVGICVLVSIMTIAVLVLYVDTSNWRAAFNLLRVYEIRMKQDLPLWAAYITTWQTKVVNIFLACILFRHKKYWLIIFPVLFQVVLYFCLANKADLFALALSLFVFMSVRVKHMRSLFGGTFFLGVSGVTVLTFFSSSGLLLYSFFSRAFFVQAVLSYRYYDFFSNHFKLFFSEGRLGSLLSLKYPYPISSDKLIMANAYGSMSGGSNASFLSSGFADMGFAGMLIVSILLSLILVYLDKACKKIPLWFVMTVLAVSINTLINSSLFTTLLTHGFILCILLLTLYGAYEVLAFIQGECRQ
jgi:hypothetical protein